MLETSVFKELHTPVIHTLPLGWAWPARGLTRQPSSVVYSEPSAPLSKNPHLFSVLRSQETGHCSVNDSQGQEPPARELPPPLSSRAHRQAPAKLRSFPRPPRAPLPFSVSPARGADSCRSLRSWCGGLGPRCLESGLWRVSAGPPGSPVPTLPPPARALPSCSFTPRHTPAWKSFAETWESHFYQSAGSVANSNGLGATLVPRRLRKSTYHRALRYRAHGRPSAPQRTWPTPQGLPRRVGLVPSCG